MTTRTISSTITQVQLAKIMTLAQVLH